MQIYKIIYSLKYIKVFFAFKLNSLLPLNSFKFLIFKIIMLVIYFLVLEFTILHFSFLFLLYFFYVGIQIVAYQVADSWGVFEVAILLVIYFQNNEFPGQAYDMTRKNAVQHLRSIASKPGLGIGDDLSTANSALGFDIPAILFKKLLLTQIMLYVDVKECTRFLKTFCTKEQQIYKG